MIIPRIKYFAKYEGKKDKKEVNPAIIGLSSIVSGSNLGNLITEDLGSSLKRGVNKGINIEDNNKIYNKLLKEAKKQGTRVYEEPTYSNSTYTGSKIGKTMRDALAKAEKNLRKSSEGRKSLDRINAATENLQTSRVLKHLGKDHIVMGGDYENSAAVLSHELGHSRYMRSGRSKSVVGKAAHKLIPLSSISSSKLGTLGHLVNGVHSGLKEEKNKSEGKKTSKWTKAKASVVPAALAAPLLIAEGKASLNGLKTMKKLGASKELLKQSRKDLGKAWGTYGGQALKGVAIGEGSRWIGKGIGKIKYSKDEYK